MRMAGSTADKMQTVKVLKEGIMYLRKRRFMMYWVKQMELFSVSGLG